MRFDHRLLMGNPESHSTDPALSPSLPNVLGPEGGVALDEVAHELKAPLILDDLDLNPAPTSRLSPAQPKHRGRGLSRSHARPVLRLSHLR